MASANDPGAEGNAEPDEQRETSDLGGLLRDLTESLTLVQVAVGGVFLIAFLFALDAGSGFFIPIILAHLLDRLFSPLVRRGQEIGIPAPFGAAIVVVALLGVLGGGVYTLSGPAVEWVETAPQKMRVAEYKLRGLKEPLERVQEAAEDVDEAASAEEEDQETVRVEDDQSVGDLLVSRTTMVVSGLSITIFLLYFLLATGDLMLRKVVRALPHLDYQKRAIRILRRIERDLSQYFGMLFLINTGLGVAVGVAMYIIGMPNPLLWGVLAGVLNFVPYLGPAVNITVVGLVALVSFEGVWYPLLAPLVYLIINGFEGSVVTPALMGWHLQLNPVVIFIGLTFWTWIWGIPGTLLAVPILVTVKVFCDNIRPLHPIGELLGQ